MHVRALEVATGKQVWDYPQIGSRRYGAGLLSTAGGLLFAGNDQGGFDALNAKTGKPLWHFNTGQPISASPIAYSFKGKDYVAIAAGSNVVAFGLYEECVRHEVILALTLGLRPHHALVFLRDGTKASVMKLLHALAAVGLGGKDVAL